VVGDCEIGNGPSCSIKCRGFIDELRNYWLPKKDTAALGHLLVLEYNTSNETFMTPHKISRCSFVVAVIKRCVQILHSIKIRLMFSQLLSLNVYKRVSY
jgi:hypothetical protein